MSNFLEQTYIKTYSSFYINSFETNVSHDEYVSLKHLSFKTNVFHDMEIHKFPILFMKEVINNE